MKIINKKAKFDYDIVKNLEAGIVLSGAEVKAIRNKNVDFHGSYVRPLEGEMYLVNMHIGAEGLEQTRRLRKLLLSKKQIRELSMEMKAKKLTLIPVSLYTNRRLIKLELALARGKRKHEKRESIKQKDIARDLELELSLKSQ